MTHTVPRAVTAGSPHPLFTLTRHSNTLYTYCEIILLHYYDYKKCCKKLVHPLCHVTLWKYIYSMLFFCTFFQAITWLLELLDTMLLQHIEVGRSADEASMLKDEHTTFESTAKVSLKHVYSFCSWTSGGPRQGHIRRNSDQLWFCLF